MASKYKGGDTFNATVENLSAAFLDKNMADALLTCALGLNLSQQEILPQRLDEIPYETGKNLAEIIHRKCTELQFQGTSVRKYSN